MAGNSAKIGLDKNFCLLSFQVYIYICVPGSINSHYFHIIGDGKNQPNSRGLYTYYNDSLLKVG